jgi:hypothetical protein
LGLPTFEEAPPVAPDTLSLGAELAGTAPDLSARFLVFMSAVTFLSPAKVAPLLALIC